MSQYPYQPPPNTPYGYGGYPQDPLAALLAPAKRASIFMFILGGLLIPCGALLGIASVADFSQIPAESAAPFRLMEQQAAAVGWTLAGILQVVAAAALVPGLLLVILGVLTRRGGMGSVIASIILCCVLALPAGFAVVAGVLQGGQGNSQAVTGACVWGGVLSLLIGALVFLFQAVRNAGQLATYRQQYQSQMQHYAQNPQAYQQHYPSQQPQNWQQPGPGQWPGQQPGQQGWPPQQQPPPPPPPQNWPPPPSNPT